MTAADNWADVPERYRGVWRRNQLDIPSLRDTTTWARWLQTARRHADLRVPEATRTAEVLSSATPHPALALHTGFFGRTEAFAAHRLDDQSAELVGTIDPAVWRVLEWDGQEMLR